MNKTFFVKNKSCIINTFVYMQWLNSEMDPDPNGTECEFFNWLEIELQFLNVPDPDSKPFVVSSFWQVWKFSMPVVPYVKVQKRRLKMFGTYLRKQLHKEGKEGILHSEVKSHSSNQSKLTVSCPNCSLWNEW